MDQISGIAEVEDFWLIVVSEGIEDETETVDMPDGCHQGDQGHSPGHPHTKYSAEEKFSIVPDGLRGKETNAELCRREGIAQGTDKLTILRLRSGNTLPLSASNCARNGASGP